MQIVLEIVLFAFIFLQLKRKKCTNFEIKNRRKRMRTIKYFNKEISVDEFIKQQIIRNDGTRSLVYKHKLVEECEKRNIKTAVTSTKEQLTELLADSGMSYKELADRYGIGVTSKNYQEAFGITHKQVKKLEKKGILKVVGNYEFRAYGRVSRHRAQLLCSKEDRA